MLFVLLATFAFMVYMVHGFDGAQKLVAGSKGGVAHNGKGFVKSTFKGFYMLVLERSTKLWMEVSEHVTKLIAKLTEKSTAAPAPNDGLVPTAKEQTKKTPPASSPTVTVAKPVQKSEGEKAKEYEERKKVAAEADKKKEEKAQAVRDMEAAQQRETEQKRKAGEKRQAAATKAQEQREQKEKLDAQMAAEKKQQQAEEKAAKKAAAAEKAAVNKAAAEKVDAQKADAENAAAEAKTQQVEQQAAPKEKQQNSGPTDTDKITQESCETFDVYDCDVAYPKLFETCREKKRACPKSPV